MMNDTGLRRILPDQSSGSGHTSGTPRHPSITDPILSKRVCFYKSGDPQFNGLRIVINNRTFKTFDALLDSLSKKVPLPFGVRNITTPRGVHAIYTLDELEDGKSYICSDSRKVKPINLALARKRLPPWYHARPVSSRRRTIQQARLFPGRGIHKQEPLAMRTPKRLLAFRNGDPNLNHTVVLHKRTTPTFESVLEYISQLLQFHVVKLYTLDGRRVDGLPGLILCSGTVVAAGREPFRPANYNAQKSPAPTRLTSNRVGRRRLKALKIKKEYPLYTSKARNFSPSSERYIVNRIHNSIAESLYNLPSNTTNSAEVESAHILESVPETEEDICIGDGAEGLDCLLPTEDDIEKSFRVNQDGSMTVEMKVRLTIKEEETIHWTTTLKRSSAANQLNVSCLPDSKEEQDICSPQSNSLDLQSLDASIDTINKNKRKDNNDEDPPSLSNGVFNESSNEEDNVKVQTEAASPRRAPTPGYKHVRKKEASVDSITSMTSEGVQEGMGGSYSYREQTENAMKEQYCIVEQSTTRPVPKPRRLGSMEANSTNSRSVSTFKSAEITEVLQIESDGKEVTETVLHLYEQQSCQDNFLANICTQGMTGSGIHFYRPATSEKSYVKKEFEPKLWRPFTASESTSSWRAESMSGTSDFTLLSPKTGAIQTTNRQQQFPEPTTSTDKPKRQRGVNKDKRVSSKPKVVNKSVWQLTFPGKRPKEKRRKAKTFSSAGFIKTIYGNKSKSAKRTKKFKRRPAQNGNGGVIMKSLQSLNDTVKCVLKDPNIISQVKENTSEAVSLETSRLNVSSSEVCQPKGILTRQTSMHREKDNDISNSMSLPSVNSSSSVTNEYIQKWLENDHSPTAHPDEECKQLNKTENSMSDDSGNNGRLITVAEEVMCPEEKSETQICETLKSDPATESLLGISVKLRMQSFENKSSIPLVEKTTATQQIAHSHADTTKTENITSVVQHNTEEIKPISNGICSETNPLTNKLSTEMPSASESSPVKMSLKKATLFSTLSVEIPLPPPPPPADNTELSNNEYCAMDVSSVLSSPLYKHPSVSSQTPDNHPLSISPASDKAVSPTNHTMETTPSIQTDIPSTLREAPSQRTSSIKRAPLVSNLSLERKMSLRKACLDKYTLGSDNTSETRTLPTPINMQGDNVLPNGICSTGTQQPSQTLQENKAEKSILDLMSNPSCTSASPTSLTSDERMSSATISSEDPTLSNVKFKETKTQPSTQKEVSSPKPSVKKVKIMSSQSPERKPQAKKLLSDLPNTSPKLSLHNHPSHKTMSPNISIRKHASPDASPATEKKTIFHKPNLQKTPSPYSQSLDMASPPVRQKSVRKMLSRNLSSDNASEPTNKTQRKTSPRRKRNQIPQSIKSTADLNKTLTCEGVMLGARQLDTAKVTDDITRADQEKSATGSQVTPQSLNVANQPNMKPVLDKVCYSIKSIRQITQNKHHSCLEKSNSLPDFSSHVASTFGSSSKVLLAFLSVMTLKECITNVNMNELNANNVSCAEALKMIDCLREIASIEDSQKLKSSLSDLQQSASKQLLQSWRGFQELSDKCRSHSSTPNYSEHDLRTQGSLEKDCGIEENVINELMYNLDIPEKLKEELASLSVQVKSESDDEEKMSARIIKKLSLNEKSDGKMSHSSTEDTVTVMHDTQDETANGDVRSIIKKFVDINQPKQTNRGSVPVMTAKHKPIDRPPKEDNGQNVVAKCPTAEPKDKQIPEERHLYSEEDQPEEKSQKSGKGDLSTSEGHSEEEEHKQPGSNYYVELNFSRKESITSPDSNALSNPASPSNAQKEQETQKSCLNVSVDESTGNSDVDMPPSLEDEQPEVECQELQVIIKESLPGLEEERESREEEEQLIDLPAPDKEMKTCKKLQVLIEESGEDVVRPGDSTTCHNVEGGEKIILIENKNLNTKNENRSLTKSDSLTKHYWFNADEDSGKDNSSCEEQVEVEQPKSKGEQINNSTEEELSYFEKESSSEEEHATMGRYIEESSEEAHALADESEEMKYEKAVDKHQSEEILSRSVAERVSLLEKQVANAQKRKNVTESSAIRCVSQRNLESDVENSPSESPTSQSTLCTRSAPQSSLSFSYHSSGGVITEPESNKVRSIREMFLAKSATDIHDGNRRYPSPNTSERPKLRPQTSASGGYKSHTSSEPSSSEDDSAQKSISKGFVRRTIERLYGKKDAITEGEAAERPPPAPKQKKKEHSSMFSPFHAARNKAMSELSYFNSTNALDTLSEATRCIAFNAQVGPGDSVPIDDGRWLLSENTLMRKSVSDPVGINKTFTSSPQGEGICEDTEESTPYSFFNTKPEEEDKKTLSRKCTYFSLPHTSDSEICQDDQSTMSKSSVKGDSVADTKDQPEDTKMCAERNTTLPASEVTDFKMRDNKVHPLIEGQSDGEVVVVQPGKGQGVMTRRLQEPDMLDFLYNFCGQHCPIL